MQAASGKESAPAAEPKKLWGGRFTGKTDPLMEKFNESLPFDKRMWAEDIQARAASSLTSCPPWSPPLTCTRACKHAQAHTHALPPTP